MGGGHLKELFVQITIPAGWLHDVAKNGRSLRWYMPSSEPVTTLSSEQHLIRNWDQTIWTHADATS
jgi:hypothetical protein